MARFKFGGTWFDGQNAVVASGTITVYLAGTTTLATAYGAETGSALSDSQTTTDTNGAFEFWIDDGDFASTQKFRFIGTKTNFSDLDNSENTDNLQILPTVPGLIEDSDFTLVDDGDNTRKLQFQLSGITTGITRTLTVPDVSDTIVTLGATQILTDKTLTTPTIGSFVNSTHGHSNAAGGGDLGAVVATSVTVSSNFLMEGYTTGRNVLRSIVLLLQPGATPATNINVTDNSSGVGFNVPSITDATNLGKNASDGSFALSSDGITLTMDITENIIAAISSSVIIHDLNNSSTTAGDIWYPRPAISGNNLTLSLRQTGTAAGTDLTTILAASDRIDILIAFTTST